MVERAFILTLRTSTSAERLDASLHHLRTARELDPLNGWAAAIQALSLACVDQVDEALDAVRGILAELEDRASTSYVELTVLGSVRACLGEMAEARRLVALGIEQHEIWWQFAKSAAWAPFRADAEGAAMLGKLGFA
jgi:ATP/maltotriose-dependent transcriptional regulator MalT